MTQAIIERVHEFIRSEVCSARGVPILDKETRLREDLQAFDLDLLQLAMELEDHYEITITDDDIENARTVGDLEALVLARVATEDA